MNNRKQEKIQYHYAKARKHPTMITNLINRIKFYEKGRVVVAKKISSNKYMKNKQKLDSLETLQ